MRCGGWGEFGRGWTGGWVEVVEKLNGGGGTHLGLCERQPWQETERRIIVSSRV